MSNVNKVKRAPVTVKLQDNEYPLRYTLNSFALMEERYGTIDAALEAMEKGSVKAVRFMLYAGIASSDENITEMAVGNMVELEDLEYLATQMGKAMEADLPPQNPGPKNGKNPKV